MTKHVLVPIDGSDPSWDALDYALEQHDGERLSVVHVVDPSTGIHPGAEGGYYDDELFTQTLERGEALCKQARDRLEERDASAETVLETAVETGRPARTILRYVDKHHVDHIVIGSHGRTGVSRVLLGSVAETVTRRADVPVTVIR